MESINWENLLTPYEKAVAELTLKLSSISNEYRKFNKISPIEEVIGRVKSVGSILEKANRKKVFYSEIEDKIEDIAGIRIICKFVEDIPKVVKLIKMRDGIDLHIKEEKDYIKNRKFSGYRSYHIILSYPVMLTTGLKEVNCEVQIRTMAMNFWATIEHSLRYKYNDNIPENIQERLTATSEAAFNLDEEMSTIRDEILEAQKTIQHKNDLVDRILNKMQKLYYVAKLDEMNELNDAFIKLYAEGDFEKLKSFNDQLNILSSMYNVSYS